MPVSDNTATTFDTTIKPNFTDGSTDPAKLITWSKRDATLTNAQGAKVLEYKDLRFPAFWSRGATKIVADKYFRVRLDTKERETSVDQMVTRVTDWYASCGVKDGYFQDAEAETIFKNELKHLLLHQYMAFNSPVWFNVGIKPTPRVSACFILDVEDTMDDILEWYKEEGLVFKQGSGSGVNLSKIRSSFESLSVGGKASGPVSFMRGADASAGAIKSGGSTRRSAKMCVLDVAHPDIEEFIDCKALEEKKARALRAAGFDMNMGGKDTYSLQYQNANNSVGLSPEFLKAYEEDKDWDLKGVKDGKVYKTVRARGLMRKIAQAAWECADPGVFYMGTLNAWHTSPFLGPIRATNPCQPSFATVLTPLGIRTFKDIEVGSVIWSGTRWTKVVRKLATGTKEVIRYSTRSGEFVGTSCHQVFQNGVRVQAGDAKLLDVCYGTTAEADLNSVDPNHVLDGLMVGDGYIKVCNDGKSSYPLLYIGQKDSDYFSEPGLKDLITAKPFDKTTHRVDSSLSKSELAPLPERIIPSRYFHGTTDVVRGFLRGLYSANGSICGGRVTLKTASRTIATQVQAMLSSIGIVSYHTVNKPAEVTFPNGKYISKTSYDVNITSHKALFLNLIGFIQSDKMRRLEDAVSKNRKLRKESYEILSATSLGAHPVWDITVDAEEHCYWTGGILASNCGEFCRPHDTSCNLASIRLTKFYDHKTRQFDVGGFIHAINITLAAMDISISNAEYPTAKIVAKVNAYRELGLGFTDLGALLMQMGVAYNSHEGRTWAALISAVMTGAAYRQSALLAAKQGAYPGWYESGNSTAHLKVMDMHREALSKIDATVDIQSSMLEAAERLWEEAIKIGELHGFRNAQVSLIAPTGTISFMMDADTTGIEPDFALIKYKKLIDGSTMQIVNQSVHPALQHLKYSAAEIETITNHILNTGYVSGCSTLKPEHHNIFACALGPNAIHYKDHMLMMAAVQPFISGAISKTINLPADVTVEEIEDIYVYGWRLGLKNLALYRDGCKAEQVLHTSLEDKDKKTPTIQAPPAARRLKLPQQRRGTTTSFRIDGCEGYVRTGEFPDGSLGEIFVDVSKQGSTLSGLMDVFAISVSLGLQHGVPLEVYVEKFTSQKFAPAGITKDPDFRMVKSLPDYIFRRLAADYLADDVRHGLNIKTTKERTAEVDTETVKETISKTYTHVDAPLCTTCGVAMRTAGSCFCCEECGVTSGCS